MMRAVYPNPTNGLIHLNTEHLKEIQVFDLSGKTIVENQPVTSTINLSDLSNGVYLIQLQLKDEQTQMERLVISK